MHFSTCDVCLYIASAKKNLTPWWDESFFNDLTRLRFSKVNWSQGQSLNDISSQQGVKFFLALAIYKHISQVLKCINDLRFHALTITRKVLNFFSTCIVQTYFANILLAIIHALFTLSVLFHPIIFPHIKKPLPFYHISILYYIKEKHLCSNFKLFLFL